MQQRREKVGLKRALSSLQHPGYRLYFISGLGLTAAMGIQMLAFAWLVLDLTGSVAQLGLVIFVRGLPTVIMSMFGGVLADRYSRRNILVYSQIFTMINMFALAALIMGDVIAIWHVYLSSVTLGLTQSLTMPARQALIRGLVPQHDLMNAVALNTIQQNSSNIIWPTVAGGLIALTGIGASILICGICYVIGIVFMLLIRDLKDESVPGTGSAVGQIIEGFRYIGNTPLIATVALMMMAISITGLSYMQLGPAFAREVLDLGVGGAGLFMMASGVGSIIGSSLLLGVEIRNRTAAFVVCGGGYGLILMAIALNPITPLAFVLMACFGATTAMLVILGQTIFQVTVPDRFLGRVMSLWSLTGGIASISTLPLGVAADEFGMRACFAVVSAILVLLTLFLAAARKPWRMQAAAEELAVASRSSASA